jgi:hypothetical protein
VNSRERGTPSALSGGALKVAAALTAGALMVSASAAFGAADPLKGGSTVLGPLKLPKKVKMSAKGGATKSGKTVTLPITGGSLDPLSGSGPVQDGGTIQLKRGKHKAKLTSIVTTFGAKGGITAKVNGKKKKLATISGGTVGRDGFGGKVTDAVAKLTKKGAKALNSALGITHGGFKGGKLGKISTTTVPSEVGVTGATSETHLDVSDVLAGCVPAGTCTTYTGKVLEDGISTSYTDGANLDLGTFTLTFTPQTGGSMAPDCSAGTLTGSQGAVHLERNGNEIVQANPQDNFAAKGVTFEATSDIGGGPVSLGRAVAADLQITSCVADAAAKTINVTATQTVNPLAANVGNTVLGLDGDPCGPAPPAARDCSLTGGESIGTTTYEIHTQ